MNKILNITPVYYGYSDCPKDKSGKIILPRNDEGVILIYRKNTINYGNGLLGLLDGSKISNKDWCDLRKSFILVDEDGTENFHWSIGGSDTGALLNLSEYSNSAKLYMDKKSKEQKSISDELDYTFSYGHINEELIAQGFQILTNMEVCKDNTVFFREDIGFMQANVDYFVRHPDGMFSVLEIKTTNSDNKAVINAYKKGIVPKYYYSQAVLHYPLTLGCSFKLKGTFFAVGYNNKLNDIIICHFDRDLENEKVLLSAEKEFYDCLRFDIEPTSNISSAQRIENDINKTPVSVEKSIEFDDNTITAVKQYLGLQNEIAKLKSRIKEIEKDSDTYKAIIIEKMSDAELSNEFCVDDNNFYCSYGNYETITINKTILKNKYPDIYKEVSKTTSSRRFKINTVKATKKG